MGSKVWHRVCVALLLIVAASSTVGAQFGSTTGAQPQIEWRVENPFRFFLDAADTEVHRATWASLMPEQAVNPILSAEDLLSERHPDGWSATMFYKTCWDRKRNRYACPERKDYLNPKSHAVQVSLKGLADAATIDCTWLTAPAGRGGRGTAATLPCDVPVRLTIPYPGGAWIKVEIGGRQVAEVMARVSDVFIVGMGDSFAAGEGNPDVPVRLSPTRAINYEDGNGKGALRGYPARIGAWQSIGDNEFIEENARWQNQACHRSLYSHQLRVALQLAVEDPHRAVTFVGVACSGAETINGLFLRYKGNEWVPNPPEFSQISAVADAQCGGRARDHDAPEAYHMNGQIPELEGLVLRKCDADEARKIDLLLLSIGGNDIGFARLVANAVLADGSMLRQLGGWFGQVYGFAEAGEHLDVLDDRLNAVNRAAHWQLHIPWQESDRVIFTGYPPMALLEDGNTPCPDGNTGMTVLSDFFFLSESKAREGNTAAERLHATMQDSARQHGWTFVEDHRKVFRGRGLCIEPADTDAPPTLADEMRLPRLLKGEWVPYNPSEWRAYAPRKRWFRTPNDAFMTGNFHVSQSLLQKVVLKTQNLAWLQPLLASVYSGAFHPTAQGQAAIADAVVEKARTILAKYEAMRRAETAPRDLGLAR